MGLESRHQSAPSDASTVVGKIVIVLGAFTAEDDALNLAELGRRTGLPKATLHRVVNDLVDVRYLERTGRRYQLGGYLFELGMRVSLGRQLLEIAVPYMTSLYDRSHEIVHLAIPNGTEVVYLAKIGGHRTRSPTRPGERFPMYCTALGKAILAFAPASLFDDVLAAGLKRRTPRTITGPGLLRQQLESVVNKGVAYEYEEAVHGVVCLAAPILDDSGQALGAISITGAADRFAPARHADIVKKTAAEISTALARSTALRALWRL